MLSESKPVEPQPVPITYAGKWIAWNQQQTRIVGSGTTLADAAEAAKASGESRPVFAKAPKADAHFAGLQR